MEKIVVKVKRIPEIQDLPLPQYMSAHASGLDLVAANEEDIVLNPNEIHLIPTGMFIALPVGYEAQIRPRSGLALKHGLTVVNSPGTIDCDYRGEVKIILGNVGKAPFTVKRGMRIAQMVIQKVYRAQLEVVDELDITRRGDGGFGHTGVHVE